MTKPELTKRIGHDVCRLIAPTVGQTVSLKAGTILHTFSARDGKSTGSTRLEEDIQYTNIGTQHAYVKDQELTNEWLENNDERREWGGIIWRPAKPGEKGYIITGPDFNAPNSDSAGRGYDQVQPGQCLWTFAKDEPATKTEPAPDPEEEAIVSEVMIRTLFSDSESEIMKMVGKTIEQRKLVRRLVREELAK